MILSMDSMSEQALAPLRRKLGAEADAKIVAAHGMIEAAAIKWPQVWEFLDRAGLGNSPHLIEQLAARAARRCAAKLSGV